MHDPSFDNADMREIVSSRSDLVEKTDALLAETRQSGELVATSAKTRFAPPTGKVVAQCRVVYELAPVAGW